MIPNEKGVAPGSDYYIYTPGAQGGDLFLCPLITGYYRYRAGYSLRRSSFNNFLLMQIKKGQCTVETGGQILTARAGQIVFLDCYSPHAYYSQTAWECEWLHFDGPNARGYYHAATEGGSPVITLRDAYRFERYLHKIYLQFRENLPLREALLNNYIVNILTELLISRDDDGVHTLSAGIIEDSVAYISGHLTAPLSLSDLAGQASLSPYYYSRLFKKETGFSPHEYVIMARINHAKYLLDFPDISVKDICFKTGFSSESGFCTTFKKVTGQTPSEWRAARGRL